jgi:hypothetical protein
VCADRRLLEGHSSDYYFTKLIYWENEHEARRHADSHGHIANRSSIIPAALSYCGRCLVRDDCCGF